MEREYIIKIDEKMLCDNSIAVFDNKSVTIVNVDAVDIAEIKARAYVKGAEDAWECARRLVDTSGEYGIGVNECKSIFGTVAWSNIFRENTAVEAIEKIKKFDTKRIKNAVKTVLGNIIPLSSIIEIHFVN